MSAFNLYSLWIVFWIIKLHLVTNLITHFLNLILWVVLVCNYEMFLFNYRYIFSCLSSTFWFVLKPNTNQVSYHLNQLKPSCSGWKTHWPNVNPEPVSQAIKSNLDTPSTTDSFCMPICITFLWSTHYIPIYDRSSLLTFFYFETAFIRRFRTLAWLSFKLIPLQIVIRCS